MKGITNFDLGLSDDEDGMDTRFNSRRPARQPPRDESIEDLLKQKDSAMVFGGGSSRSNRRGYGQFDTSGSMDILDAELVGNSRRAARNMEPDDDEARDFDLEWQQTMEASLGIAAFNDARSESPFVQPSANGSDGSMNDLFDEILDDAPKKPPTARSRSTPSSAANEPRTAQRLASPGIGSYADSRGSATPPTRRESAANDSDLFTLELNTGRPPPKRLASPGLGSGNDSRGSATPPPRKDFGGNDSDIFPSGPERGPSQSTPSMASLNVDLQVEVKPRRKLGGPKAKPSPAPSSSRTPLEDPEPPSLDRATPQPLSGRASPALTRTASPPPVSSQPETAISSQPEARTPSAVGANRQTPPPVRATPPLQASRMEGASEEEFEDNDDLNDLFQDNTRQAFAPRAPPTPPEASHASDPKDDPKENSDDGLPDFLLERNRGPRRGQTNVGSTLPKSTGFDLGFAEEDLEKSDQSDPLATSPLANKPTAMPTTKPVSPPATKPGQSTERPGLLDVPLNVESTGRSLAKAKAKAPSATKEKPTVPMHLGMDSAPPSVQGDFAGTPGLPRPELPRSFQLADGLPPGSPLTQTAQSESGSLHARFHPHPQTMPANAHHPESLLANAQVGGLAMNTHVGPTSIVPGHGPMIVGSPPLSVGRKSVAGADGVGGCSPGGSDPNLSLFGPEPGHHDFGGRAFGGFSEYPPLTAAPSRDLLSKLAESEAKVRYLEQQLEDSERHLRERLDAAKRQCDGELDRKELQCRQLEADLERCNEVHRNDLDHVNRQKQKLLLNFDMEKEEIRREERRKAQSDIEKLRIDKERELEELRRQHERSLYIAKQQAEMEAENLKRAQSGDHQLTKLVEQVQGSVAEVERMSRRVDADKSLEWSVQERQLEAREKQVLEMEHRLSAQSKEVEEQRRKVSELVRHMQSCQVDEKESLKLERERLQAEHNRLLALQQSVREADRNNKEAMKHAWAQLEDERHSLKQEQLRFENDSQAQRDETEVLERQQRQQTERLKALHNQVEVARQNASRRIRETEATIANERRVLMSELEVFEEKRRNFAAELQNLEHDRVRLDEDRSAFEQEVKSVGQMAAQVERESGELKSFYDQCNEARSHMLRLHDQIHEKHNAQSSQEERLKTMQTLVEQQRLQLLQTENQLRIRSIEDIDLLVTTQSSTPGNSLGEPMFNPLDLGPAFPYMTASPQDPMAVVTSANLPSAYSQALQESWRRVHPNSYMLQWAP